MEAALRAQATEVRSPSRQAYVARWNAWAQQAPTDTENRDEAVRRMTQWLDSSRPSDWLNLSGLKLSSLPDNLPAALTKLNVRDNRLTSLPDNLPASLTKLDVRSNRLTSLPESLPASLTRLDAWRNRLTSLPENLPASLTKLDVSDNDLTSLPENLPALLTKLIAWKNRLTSLPANLPASLTVLKVGGNQLTSLHENLPASLTELNVANNNLTSLPESITTRFGSSCTIDLENNPLSDRVRSNLAAAMNVIGYRGPRISFSMPSGVARNQAAIPLPEAVARWYSPADQAAATETWSAFAGEPQAVDFSRFLVRLQGTVNSASPEFKQATVQWLTHLADHPGLRQDTFVISQGATERCEDRVSLTLNSMKSARLTADVQRGDYDQRLPELLTLAKGMFRLGQLEGIAREKVKSLNLVDEIEVYLAYQVKLREPLALPLDTADMRFFSVSYVTEQDLTKAMAQVQSAEREQFPDFLASQWQPWQSVLQRLVPERYEQASDQLIKALGKPFEERLQKRLEPLGLQENPDAQREIGPQVTAEIVREIKLPLTRDFLRERGLESHFQPD